jgi:hypothetical protein
MERPPETGCGGLGPRAGEPGKGGFCGARSNLAWRNRPAQRAWQSTPIHHSTVFAPFDVAAAVTSSSSAMQKGDSFETRPWYELWPILAGLCPLRQTSPIKEIDNPGRD